MIAAAGDLDIRFHRLFGALHDDFARRYASVGLACAIIAAGTKGVSPAKVRGELATNPHLRRLGLTRAAGPLVDSAEAPLRLAATMIDWLLTGDADALSGPEARRLRRPAKAEAARLLSADRLRRVRASVRHALVGRDGDRVSAIMLAGSAPDWIRVEAAEISEPAMIIGPAAGETNAEVLAGALTDIADAAFLSGRRVVADLDGDGPEGDALWQVLTASWDLFDQPPYVIADNPERRLATAPQPHIVVADLPADPERPPRHDRRRACRSGRRQRRTDRSADRRLPGPARRRAAGSSRGTRPGRRQRSAQPTRRRRLAGRFPPHRRGAAADAGAAHRAARD
ncbi:hypothetical protein PIB19_20450 [Sphingomonas sp. 7/4-4]|uniref:hypothetical protein n=1 Tax=Sphingomonas sp. 7/4-4 TaxID=3018446 RepID=UPI0022F3D066|nr:hypothetical protein [Sphingomonas sp. 7/4-4]WBY07649.1 hypothetical protein PIB19_20450 [Sphingomonas sp. 7/4-4]